MSPALTRSTQPSVRAPPAFLVTPEIPRPGPHPPAPHQPAAPPPSRGPQVPPGSKPPTNTISRASASFTSLPSRSSVSSDPASLSPPPPAARSWHTVSTASKGAPTAKIPSDQKGTPEREKERNPSSPFPSERSFPRESCLPV
ncbi:hypothetical protein PVAP13_7NG259400 [Panicum virgatum]|uniref:Uncharacterized protein n=1 Tax=Panicum virgatum TaxID=38727 RepID=A0A8T0Q289_PANVG|nr:hypothetical protein PVAP13_7NG259400 [Panicum virgatum]